jgi:hypothetical protein
VLSGESDEVFRLRENGVKGAIIDVTAHAAAS